MKLKESFIKMKINETFSHIEEDKEHVPENLIAIMRVVSSVIVILNGSVLICLLRWRHTFPTAYWYQIVCITCNDILAGISSFIMSFLDCPFFGEHVVACSMTVGPFFITQCATLYNILAICINRFVVLKGLKRRQNLWKKVHTIYGTIAAWSASILLCSAPFAIWSDSVHFSKYRFCSMKGIFDDHVSSAMKVFLGSFLIPLVLTDVLYCSMFVVLKKEFKIMHATTSRQGNKLTIVSLAENADDVPCTGSVSRSCEVVEEGSTTLRCQAVQTEVSTTSSDVSKGARCTSCEHLQACQSMLKPSNIENVETEKKLTTECCHDKSANGQCTCSHELLEDTEFIPNGNLDTKTIRLKQKRNSVPILRVRRAFWLLGLILIALNVFTWPGLTALFFGSMLDSFHISRSLILPLFSTLSLNSVVNPILYTVRVPEFREVLYRTILKSCHKKM